MEKECFKSIVLAWRRNEMEHTLDQFGKEKITPHPTRTAAIVLAAGQGKRMKSNIQKQFLLLEEKPVIWYALHAFEESRSMM